MTPERRYFYLSVAETATAVACLPMVTILIASQNEWQLPDPNTDSGVQVFMILLVIVMSLAMMLKNTMTAWDKALESDMKGGRQ